MKTSPIFGFALIFLTLVFALASANFGQPEAAAKNLGAASLSAQVPTPVSNGEDLSEVGSTDGIVAMGFALVAIVTLPLLFHRRGKKQN
ncbi:MAG: hypothetical protein LDL50_02735 [Chloroflexi bacterium]|nr:hypothetical protein [Chloroflexota bacterium]MCA2002411.1 hypothetical protein [Chloroflexota bacterium]